MLGGVKGTIDGQSHSWDTSWLRLFPNTPVFVFAFWYSCEYLHLIGVRHLIYLSVYHLCFNLKLCAPWLMVWVYFLWYLFQLPTRRVRAWLFFCQMGWENLGGGKYDGDFSWCVLKMVVTRISRGIFRFHNIIKEKGTNPLNEEPSVTST